TGAGVVGSYQEPPLMVADRTAVVQDRSTAREAQKKLWQTVVLPSSTWYLRGITIIRVVGIKGPEPEGNASRGVPRPGAVSASVDRGPGGNHEDQNRAGGYVAEANHGGFTEVCRLRLAARQRAPRALPSPGGAPGRTVGTK